MALQFSRNAKVYVELVNSAGTHVQAWKLAVLDGFSYTQSINSSEVTINEAGADSRRARLLFNDSLAPVEWSISTYARPTLIAGPLVRPIEESLWAMFLGADTYVAGVFSNAAATGAPVVNTVAANSNTFNLNGSNVSSMSDRWNIYFSFEDGANIQVYKCVSSVVSSISVDFDIDGIATIAWSGSAKDLVNIGTTVPAALSTPIITGLTDTTNFIRNRISTLSLVRTDVSPADVYNIVITGGNVTFENNITYLTPEELGVVNKPLANITGARSISGSLTCYLDNDEASSKSGELFTDLVADSTSIRNVFDMAINIGGETASTPRLTFDIPTAHLEIPTVNVEDLLTLEVAFHGQVAGGNVDSTDEATIIYKS